MTLEPLVSCSDLPQPEGDNRSLEDCPKGVCVCVHSTREEEDSHWQLVMPGLIAALLEVLRSKGIPRKGSQGAEAKSLRNTCPVSALTPHP